MSFTTAEVILRNPSAVRISDGYAMILPHLQLHSFEKGAQWQAYLPSFNTF